MYSELPDAQGDKRKQLLLLARQAALMIRAMRAEIRLPENRGQTSVSQKSERQRIEKLIKQLGDQQYGVRQRAMTRLIAVGEAARSALVRARLSLDLEVRWRVAHILDSLRQANALEVQRMVPALWEVAAVDGRSVKLTRKLGPALNKNCEYRAVVMGDPNKRTVVFRSTGPDGLTLKSGLLAKGQTLAYLVLKKVADGKRGTGQ